MFTVGVRIEKLHETTVWCDNNIGKEGIDWYYGYVGTGGPMIYTFHTEEELMWFTLVCGEYTVLNV